MELFERQTRVVGRAEASYGARGLDNGSAVATNVLAKTPSFKISFPVIFGVLVWGGLFVRDPGLRGVIPLRQPRREPAGILNTKASESAHPAGDAVSGIEEENVERAERLADIFGGSLLAGNVARRRKRSRALPRQVLSARHWDSRDFQASSVRRS
ncbi:MAG TPA: hypothetical protein VMV61_04300 [Patescibacteria group bacterium]|nr:hypothetical protein [Patescibacteria group bacterium]